MKALQDSMHWPRRRRAFRLGRVVEAREITLIVLIAAVVTAMAFVSPYFLTAANFRAMAIGLAPTAIIAVGMTFLLVSGGFDLSVGSVLALTGTVLALLVVKGLPIQIALAGTMLVGAAIGAINGFLVTRVGVNPLVATLGTLSVARGIALVLTDGFSVSGLPSSFGFVGSAGIAGIPLTVWIMALIVLIADLALRHTRALRQLYFVGANEAAARLSGIPVDRVRVSAYVASSLLATLAGMLLASRLMAGTPTAGNALELQVLAAAVIGGASLRGGEGTVLGAFLGVIFVALINNAMIMLAVSIYWQMVVTGIVLTVAVALDMLVRGRPR
ncbi:ABC transporter permease (plasmid) [Bradyrhizobium sp. CB82]|uniref:ABC transporter permease n=1 Tax=Bradyrhizobium sp. CB82 TaxID=3039159 RepID=UPI0024B1F24B|nr:ABC transporter permease [Bradyrhizobium sp. CB82]WFU45962.1 ABC transporter permease [Bradyrhizobium sp. CB82]